MENIYYPLQECIIQQKKLKKVRFRQPLISFLRSIRKIENVELHLDYGKAGRLATKAIQKVLPKQYYTRDKPPERGKDYKKYSARNFTDNKIMTKNVHISYNMRKHQRNVLTMVVGESGFGKTFRYAKPNLIQANTSFVVLDSKGENLRDTGHLLFG